MNWSNKGDKTLTKWYVDVIDKTGQLMMIKNNNISSIRVLFIPFSFSIHRFFFFFILYSPCCFRWKEIGTGRPRFIVLGFTALHKCCGFLQIKGKPLYQQKDYDSVYCDSLFVVVVGNPTCSLSPRYACDAHVLDSLYFGVTVGFMCWCFDLCMRFVIKTWKYQFWNKIKSTELQYYQVAPTSPIWVSSRIFWTKHLEA